MSSEVSASHHPMRTLEVAGRSVPALGQGTWHMGDASSRREGEIAALRTGLDLGLTLIDTAEMYGSGRAELLVGEAIRGRREEVFLVSKVLPDNASHDGTFRACEQSLRRLGTDHLDLYLLHWEGSCPLEETFGAFEELRAQGKIGAWGVSNFDRALMAEATVAARAAVGAGGSRPQDRPATNQVLFNLQRRWPEGGLLEDLRAAQIPLMAYSPIEQGALAGGGRRRAALTTVARRHGATEAQIALAWVISQPGVFAIPKAGSTAHVRENAAAASIQLTAEDHAELDAAFPKPGDDAPLELI
ncbi:aldo/keto reductase [Tessaracoccus sp. MC1756]|uniref:aldo/keto reductase n=1 Tax=Tessaracoccus sp. MC1756 TaxID=2760311 RepID=UPI002102FEEA|nr:aldo/keto reductase [Tessaracoccus sp. MC1756]